MQARWTISVVFAILVLSTPITSQGNSNGTWTWMGGVDAISQPDNYGVQGVGSPTNMPGSRQNAASWEDRNGNFWLFGGLEPQGVYGGPTGSAKNDLWEFNPSTRVWTWIGGSPYSSTSSFPIAGVYGTQGLAAATNFPGARSNASTWTDSNGNFWLFGGTGFDAVGNYGDFNDLWEFNPDIGVWTWVSGSSLLNQQGVYGVQGAADPANAPGARDSATMWIDTRNNIWIFGGYIPRIYPPSPSNPPSGPIADLWKFDLSTKMWTWIGGNNVAGTYPIDPRQSFPSSRGGGKGWVDSKGSLWLFGGDEGYEGPTGCAPVCGGSTSNEMWMYSPSNNAWTRVTGSEIPDAGANYGMQGVASSSNSPGARTGAVSWTDSGGHFWLFGGAGQDSVSVPGATNYLNDLWEFDPSQKIWTWVSGSNIGGSTGSFGVLGKQASTNVPGARAYATGWIDSEGNLWFFGGQGLSPITTYTYNGIFNDLWMFKPGIAPVIVGPPSPPSNGNGQSSTGPSLSSTSKQGQIAEPVSTGSGNYYYSHTDFAMPSRGLSLGFQRSYNSLDSFNGPLGANWNHSYNVILTQTSSGVATIRWGDGHAETFALEGSAYVAQPGVFSTFFENSDGTYTLTQKSQTSFNFSGQGKLTNIIDKNGNAVQLGYDSNGNLTSITGVGGRGLSLAYDTSGRIIRVTDPMGFVEAYTYSVANDLATYTDSLSGITTYTYDSNHHVVQITLPNGNTLLKNTYDQQGRVISQTNGRGFTWQFAYDTPASGQTTITDARGGVTVHSYDTSQRIVSVLDALGDTTSYTYDSNNNRTSVTNKNGKTTSFAYDTNGNVTSVTDALSNNTAFTYDAMNDLLSVTAPKGGMTSLSYDAHGNLIGIQDALGNKTALAFDSFGELTSKTDAKGNTTAFSYSSAGDLMGIKDALGISSSLAYDGDGRLLSITDPNLHTASSTYDALGRLTQVSDALGNKTTFAYDAAGSLLSVTDANEHVTNYAYDATDNLVTVTDALGHITKYAYDQNNNRIGFTNAKNNTTTYQYDLLNRLIRSTDPLSLATAYGYDPTGNVVTVTDAKGQTNGFTYDKLNRLLSISYGDGKTVAYSYDADGNRMSMIDWTGTTAYAYDALGRLTSVTSPGNKTVGYSYDANGRRASLTYPDGKVIKYGYDADDRLLSVSDWLSHVTQYTYDPAGNLLRTQYPNKARIDFAYDAANRLTSVVNTTIGVPPLAFKYALDAVGNRTVVTEAGIPTNYSYDAINELTSAQTWPFKSSWTYDPIGNRLSEASLLGVTNYTYDASDRLLKAGTRSFTYDANGNEISMTDAFTHLKRTYAFDASNRLVAVDGGRTAAFVYDGDGNRVSQATGTLTQTYVNDTAAALPIVLQDTYNVGPPSTYVYGLSLIESTQGRDNNFYQYDGLGSVIQLTNAAGIPELSYFYDAWGNAILPAPPTNPFRFTGQTLDSATGLYYLRARFYDPSVGRLISKDSSTGNASISISTNRYVYAWSNPIRFIDPSGNDSWEAFWDWCGGFSQTCASVAAATQKAAANNYCTQNIESSTNGCNNGLPQSIAKANTQVTETGTNVVTSLETTSEIYGMSSISPPWYVKVGTFLWDIFTPNVAHAASTPAANTPSSPPQTSPQAGTSASLK